MYYYMYTDHWILGIVGNFSSKHDLTLEFRMFPGVSVTPDTFSHKLKSVPQWNFVCVMSRHDALGSNYTVSVDGVYVGKGFLHLNFTNILLLKYYVNSTRVFFSGKITNLKIFDHRFKLDNINCTTSGNYLPWGSQHWEITVGIDVNTSVVSLKEVCSLDAVMYIFSIQNIVTYEESQDTCAQYGKGVLPSVDEIKDVVEYIQQIKAVDILKETWLWMYIKDNTTLTDKEGQANTTANQKNSCTVCDNNECIPYSCTSSVNFVCKFTSPITFRLQGPFEDPYLDTQYYPYTLNGYVHYIGRTGTILYPDDIEKDYLDFNSVTNPRIWKIGSKSNSSHATTNAVEKIIGVNSWAVLDKKSNKKVVLNLTLNSCNDTEFNCDDGSCVPLDYRCDVRIDCKDKSDEKNCDIVKFKDYHYSKEIIYIGSTNRHTKLNVSFLLTIKNFLELNENNGVFRVNFLIKINWNDNRLNFLNLKKNSAENILTSREFEEIWKPILIFQNKEVWRHDVNIGPKVAIEMNSMISTSTFDSTSPIDDLIYDGQRNYLSLKMDIRLGLSFPP